MRFMNDTGFSLPTMSKINNRGRIGSRQTRNIKKDVDPLKAKDGYTDPIGEAKRQLARAFVNGQSGRSKSTSNHQAGYRRSRVHKGRKNLRSMMATLQKVMARLFNHR